MLRLSTTLLFLIPVFSSCLSLGDGSDSLIKESSNERHTKKAILFLRQAGATVADSYQVSVTDYENTFDTTQVGNTFTVDTNHGDTGLDSTSINFIWLSDDSLQIDYDKKLRTFIQQANVDGVTITYKAR
jgi:hypothetical protein